MSLVIRKNRAEDREGWQILWDGYQAFYGVDLSHDCDRLWKLLCAPPEHGPHCLLAEETNGNLVGLAHFLYHSTTWSREPRCYLNDLYTLPQARGKGVARALIEELYRTADQHGASQVYWLTKDDNETARRLYDRVAINSRFIKYVR